MYRPDIPPVPARLQRRPVERGYPVPWFCAQVDGRWDFRIADPDKFVLAVQERRCWICGERLGSFKAFCIGPMCVINRTISEPPAHTACAEWSIRACPFLTQRQQRRNEAGLPEGVVLPPGIALRRQPGVAVLWVTKHYTPFQVGEGVLFAIGDPVSVSWWREGRPATRAECEASIAEGFPLLEEVAASEGPTATQDLMAAHARARDLLPPA